MDFIIFVLSVAGLSHLVVDGKLFEWFRSLLPPHVYDVVRCYGCVGFFSGIICGFLLYEIDLGLCLLFGFAGSYIAELSDLIKNYLESKII